MLTSPQTIYVQVANLPSHMLPTQIPSACNGLHQHNQLQWRNFFVALEPLKSQCLAAGRRLVSVMGEIRASDHQGVPSRRQLYAQHRALSRALMDPDLQNLRRKGQVNLTRLKEIAMCIADNGHPKLPEGGENASPRIATSEIEEIVGSVDVSVRLAEVITIFDEVDRAARRLEQLTEQRRERLRELTRQRALEDEINEVSAVYLKCVCRMLCDFHESYEELPHGRVPHEMQFFHRLVGSCSDTAAHFSLVDSMIIILHSISNAYAPKWTTRRATRCYIVGFE